MHAYIHTHMHTYVLYIHTLQYDAMAMVGYRDDKDCFLVDFEQKRWDQVYVYVYLCVCSRARACCWHT